ncbi:MAG: ABC transporter ATP-binding protein [Desulfobacterales bacterium]|nr:ABC transporter ATP-binding protein [Desulfobacterales bacterium]MDD4073286.1 ABC transporter ATP-binding protein [Desulfobacterales bacterium]MDD4393854.1 ABC transporter ATP-binding protein [Desulfobacterales bacterium]
MIHLSGVFYQYPASGGRVLNGIDLRVDRAEYIVVCGGNGSGKSTFGYLLNGLIPHFFGGTLTGTVTVAGMDTRNGTGSDMAAAVGLVFQNPDAQLFNMTVEKEIAFGLESLGLVPEHIDRRIDAVAGAFDIGHLLNTSPENLSGGEKRLVAIASVICLDPSVIVLDEPFANLDQEAAVRVRQILKQIYQSGKTVVVIEHLMADLLEDATRCVLVRDGRICFDGEPPAAGDHLIREGLVSRYPIRHRVISQPQSCRPVVSVKNLSCRMNGTRILEKVSFDLNSGESVALIGKNGAGKTTLIKHLNGLLCSGAGSVVVHGIDAGKFSPQEMASSVGLCFQNSNDQFFKSSVKEELMAGLPMTGRRDDLWMNEICDMFDLRRLLEISPYQISEGEKKRVAIGSILAMKPEVLVLDEPTAGQDGRFREALARMLKKYERRNHTILIVTHDLDFARATTDRWIVLENGRIASDGSPGEKKWGQDSRLTGLLSSGGLNRGV